MIDWISIRHFPPKQSSPVSLCFPGKWQASLNSNPWRLRMISPLWSRPFIHADMAHKDTSQSHSRRHGPCWDRASVWGEWEMKAQVPTEQGKTHSLSMRTEMIKRPSSLLATVGERGAKEQPAKELEAWFTLEKQSISNHHSHCPIWKVLCDELNWLKRRYFKGTYSYIFCQIELRTKVHSNSFASICEWEKCYPRCAPIYPNHQDSLSLRPPTRTWRLQALMLNLNLGPSSAARLYGI